VFDKNIIQKQVMHFQYNGKADGFALQKEVSDWCKFTLIPGIEQELELYALSDDYISIDKLVIDATVDKKDWQQKIRNELMLSLKTRLANYTPVIGKAAPKNETVTRKLDECILFYFEKGYLPWWSKALVNDDLETVLHNWIKEEMPQHRADQFSMHLQRISTVAVVERVINLVPGQLYFQFLKNIFKKESRLIDAVDVFLKETMLRGMTVAKRLTISRSVHRFILNMIMKNGGKIDKALLVRFFYEELNIHKVATRSEEHVVAETAQTKNPVKMAWLKLLAKENEIAKKKAGDPERLERKLKYNKLIDKLTGRHADTKPDAATLQQEGIYIENAGAVVIAAFIPALFEKLKISKDQTIVNSDLAAMMVQYAVTGKRTMAEHELVLPKILCGIDLELPVNTNNRITAAQAKEADEMLGAVIEYWAIIKDTSVQGLRESFLQRSGKLSMLNNEWLLQVEQKPYDMLLQQLPWSFSMIKMPWMKNLLKTEWV
jgi:hypothetical protein